MYAKQLFVGLALALVVGACGSSEDPDRNPASGGVGGVGGVGASAGSGASSATGGADSGTGGSAGQGQTDADYAIFQSILNGKIGASDGLSAIAASNGFPIELAEGFLFAHLDDAKAPYSLAGDFSSWSAIAMKAEAGLYWIVQPIANPDGAKYKFVDTTGAFNADPFARRYNYDENGEVSLVRASAAHLERWLGVSDGTLAKRELRIWLPAEPATHHLYVHDGQNLFDPAAPFGGWKLQTDVGPKTLVVGIDNSAARMDEYTHVPDSIGGSTVGGKGDVYSDFVKNVVRPLVETHYGKPARAGVMGSSLGGLISFHEALRNPEIWDFSGSLSGTFGWGSIGANNETLIQRFDQAPKLSTKLYLDSGGGPGSGCVDSDADGTNDDSPDAGDNYCETLQLRDVLGAKGYVFDVDLWHWWEQGASHNEAAWAARVNRPVQIFEGL